jgi:hypothetical protein
MSRYSENFVVNDRAVAGFHFAAGANQVVD